MLNVCKGTVRFRCIDQCSIADKIGRGCATAYVQKGDSKELILPDSKAARCKSSVPEGTTPFIVLCKTIKGVDKGGFSNLEQCSGNPKNVMQLLFHELIHYCGASHKLDARGKPVFEGDLAYSCVKSCFGTGPGDVSGCKCC